MARQESSAASQISHFTISHATTPADIAAVSTMFTAYTKWLNIDLTFQNFAKELASLPGAYTPPKGALLLARSEETGEALGCVALRPLQIQPGFRRAQFEDNNQTYRQTYQYCEVKRLYTSPAARGKGVARALIKEALAVAKREGYSEALLDTLPQMTAAVALYKSEGFVETQKYYDNPLEGVLYMSHSLTRDHA